LDLQVEILEADERQRHSRSSIETVDVAKKETEHKHV